jgi:hypothetical protein
LTWCGLRIRIQVFKWMQTRIQLWKWMWIRIQVMC